MTVTGETAKQGLGPSAPGLADALVLGGLHLIAGRHPPGRDRHARPPALTGLP